MHGRLPMAAMGWKTTVIGRGVISNGDDGLRGEVCGAKNADDARDADGNGSYMSN